jgi:hypothetical protein
MSKVMIRCLLIVLVVVGPTALARGEHSNSSEEAPAPSLDAETINQGSEASASDAGISAALFGQVGQSDFTATKLDNLAQAIGPNILTPAILTNSNRKASEPTLDAPADQKNTISYSPEGKRNVALLIFLIFTLGRQH